MPNQVCNIVAKIPAFNEVDNILNICQGSEEVHYGGYRYRRWFHRLYP
jgi:hypothetical protein